MFTASTDVGEHLQAAELVVQGVFAVIAAALVGLGLVFGAWHKLKPHIEEFRTAQSRVLHQTENDHKSNLRDDIDKITQLVEDVGEAQNQQSLLLIKLDESVSRGKDSDLAQWERVAAQAMEVSRIRDRVEKLERDTKD